MIGPMGPKFNCTLEKGLWIAASDQAQPFWDMDST